MIAPNAAEAPTEKKAAKQAVVVLSDDVHRALKMKALITGSSAKDLADEIMRAALAQEIQSLQPKL